MEIQKLKEGYLQRYKSSFLSSKWKSCYAILFSDSTLQIYNDREDSKPVEIIFLKNVSPYICVGIMTDKMPIRRPELPSGVAIQRLVGIGMDPKANKVHWLLFPSENSLEIWFNEIFRTLPVIQPQQSSIGVQQLLSYNSNLNTYVPPSRYPDVPPIPSSYQKPQHTGYNQPQQFVGYNQPQISGYGFGPTNYSSCPPSNTTVIIDRGNNYGNYGCGFGGGSTMLGAGLGFGGGLLMGSLLSHGIGSHYGGYSGQHFGSGYIQDNDTYVTNNFYNNDNNSHNYQSSQVDSITNDQEQSNNTYTGNDDNNFNFDSYDDGGGFDSGEW